jgi:hypothetical protein
MKNIISGSCLCGHIKYEYSGKLGPSSYCHCTDCRKVTGTAYLVSVRFETKDFKIITRNSTKNYTKYSDSGIEITREFCPECGSPLFTFSPSHPDYVYVKAGSLDDPSIVKPLYQSWTDSKVEWANIPKDIKSFAKSRH